MIDTNTTTTAVVVVGITNLLSSKLASIHS